MAAIPHPCFRPPAQGTKLWRYLSFTKFAAMVLEGGLWFSRADLLGDDFEVSVPKVVAEKWRSHLASLPEEQRAVERDFFRRYCEHQRTSFYVSCWHAQEGESAAMWKLYGQSSESIAVQTTYESLTLALPKFTHCGMVQYFDHDGDAFHPFGNTFEWVMHKRDWFKDERECRAVIWSDAAAADIKDGLSLRIYSQINASRNFGRRIGENVWSIEHTERSPASGVLLPIEFGEVIHSVYLGPQASAMVERLTRLLLNQCGATNVNIKPSAMSEKPILGTGEDDVHPAILAGLEEILR
jgi:hypothetical protein